MSGLVCLPLSAAAQQVPEQAAEASELEPDGPGELIIIYGDEEVARRRAALDVVIRDTGYKSGVRHGDHTTYRPIVPWKPTIVIQEEGLVKLKRSPVRWMAPGKHDNPLNNVWCLPPFTPMCLRIGGQVVSTTKLDYAKGRVMEQVHDPSEAWRSAIASKATWDRVNKDVPRQIEALWREGTALDPDTPTLTLPAQRRTALLTFWATRADSPEGFMVAAVVADFLRLEVQTSASPITFAELAQANALAAPIRRLDLGLSTAGPGAVEVIPQPAQPAAPAGQDGDPG